MSGESGQNDSKRDPLPLWQRAALFAVAYWACAVAGNYLSPRGGTYVSFWLPAGLAVAVLLLNRTRDWPWLLLAVLPANFIFDFFHGTPLPVILCFYGVNTVQAVTGAWLVRRFVAERPTLATLKEFVGLVALAGGLSTTLGALLGAETLKAFGLSHPFLQSFGVWWGSTAMAVLILSPFILTRFSQADGINRQPVYKGRAMEAVLLYVGLGVYVWYLLARSGGILSPSRALIIPLLLWAGLRFGVRGATTFSLVLATSLSFLPAQFSFGLTPEQVASGSYVIQMQFGLALAALVAIVPAIVLGERDRTTAKLRESEQRYRDLTQAAFEGIGISEHGRVVDANDQMLKMFGYELDEMVGKQVIELVAPESREIVAESIRAGREEIYEHRLVRKDGSSFFAEARAKIVRVGGRALRMTALRDITERKRAEEALRASEELFRGIIEDQTEMIVRWKPDGTRTFVNSAYCRVFGGTREQLVGTNFFPLISEQDRDAVLARIHALTPANPVSTAMHRSVSPTGELLWQEWTDRALFDEHGQLVELQSTGRDITDRKKAEQELRESVEKFSKAFRTGPDVMSISDFETGRYLDVNEAHEKILGFKREEVIGRSPLELGILEDVSVREAMMAELKARGSLHEWEFQARTRDGRRLTMLHSAELIEIGGRMCALRVSHDITDRKRAEAERKAAEESLRQLQEREMLSHLEFTQQLIASQEVERKRIAAELHDSLGQNLLLIKNLAQMILRDKKPRETYEQVASIDHLAAQCIAEARQISRDLHPHQIDHLGLKRALEAMMENTAQASEIKFAWKFDDVDGLFPANAAMNLYRIVQESLNNIMKHSRAKNVVVRLERDVHEVQLRIEDDGCGFESESIAGSKRGLGLKNMVERARILGGKLRMDSKPGEGVKITLAIPVPEET